MMSIHNLRRAIQRAPAALPVLAGLLAGWWLVATATALLAPRAPAWRVLRAPQPQADAGSVAQQAWFGSSQQAAAQAAPPLQVVGVLGGGLGSHQDFAIVLENGQMQPLRVGEQSPGGWWLRKVDGAGIVIQQAGGAAVRVVLSRTAANTVVTAANTGLPQAAPAFAAPAGNGQSPPVPVAALPAEGGGVPAGREAPVNKD